MEPVLKLDTDGHTAVLTLNRPEKLNALSSELREALAATLDEVRGKDEIRVLIITGAGPRLLLRCGPDRSADGTGAAGTERAAR